MMDDIRTPIMVPNIEDNIPLPKSAAQAFPELTTAEELEMRANTIKLIADLLGREIEPTPEDISTASDMAEEMMKNPALRPEFSQYPNETMAYLAGLVAQTNCMLVNDLADFKLYVLNSLVRVAETTKNPKEKIAALRSIGEVDGVDAFKKRTEVIHTIKTPEEAENELQTMISNLRARLKDKKPKDEPQIIDVVEITED